MANDLDHRRSEISREAMQLHGRMRYAEETDVSRSFVDARAVPIFEDAEVLSLRVIGRSLLAP
jgi:(2S)-methylsuccinyl-CoA dehydrogenase